VGVIELLMGDVKVMMLQVMVSSGLSFMDGFMVAK
jgi:hypothetical protein